MYVCLLVCVLVFHSFVCLFVCVGVRLVMFLLLSWFVLSVCLLAYCLLD